METKYSRLYYKKETIKEYVHSDNCEIHRGARFFAILSIFLLFIILQFYNFSLKRDSKAIISALL